MDPKNHAELRFVNPLIIELFGKYTDNSTIRVREFPIPDGHDWEGKEVRGLNLSHNTTVVSIVRKGKAVIPKGNTIIHKGDLVTVCEKHM